MFDIGPEKLLALVIIGLILLGPERLPSLARDLGRMFRQLREMATGARNQLKNELGPEFSDLDLQALRELRSLNPRAAISRVLLDDEEDATPPAPPRSPAPEPATPGPAGPRPLGRGEKAPIDTDAT